MLPAKFSYIGLQEIWSVGKCYSLPGYSKLEYRTRDMKGDPDPHCGGGVGFFLSNQFPEYEILENESIFLPGVYESIFVKIKLSSGKFKIIGNIYRPNSAPRANLKLAISTHCSIISGILANKVHKKCPIEIISDFNVDLLNFEQHADTKEYLESMSALGFLPVITRPTRVTHNSATLIDHIFVRNTSSRHTAGIVQNNISDHYPTFYIDQCKNPKRSLHPFKTRKINADTIPGFQSLLKGLSWEGVINENDPIKAFETFDSNLSAARDLAFPEVLIKPKLSNISHNVWMTPGLLISCKTKHKLYSKRIKHPTLNNINIYKTFNNIYNKTRWAAKKLHFSKCFTACKDDLRQTWSLIREVTSSNKNQKDTLPDWFRVNNKIITDSQDIANQFNQYFAEVGPKLAEKIPESSVPFTSFLGEPSDTHFQFSTVSELKIFEVVKQLKAKWSHGEDCISSNLLKIIIPIIILPLKHLINLSLKTGFVPPQVGKIVPIFKDSDRHDFNFYRPVCLLSSIWKLIERIVCFQLMEFLDRNDVLYKHQYGFRARHNTSQPLLHFTENISKALNSKRFNLSIFIDLKKAFETVNFDILLSKLHHYGVRNAEQQWFKNYLTNRFQYCTVHGKSSEKLQVKCGIPTGSVAGPLLFIIFVNDLPCATDFFSILFADDCTFQLTGSDPDYLIRRANAEMIKAQSWFQANKLTLNINKTKYIMFKNKGVHAHFNDVCIGDDKIDRVGELCKEKAFKFLGHWVDENLTWDFHLKKLQSKLISANYALNTAKDFVPLRIRKTIYRSLFESHLHFGSLIYGSANPSKLSAINNLQKQAVRSVARAKYRAHADPLFQSLKILKIPDLIRLNQTLFVHKYRSDRLPPSFSNYLTPNTVGPSSGIRHADYNYQSSRINVPALCYMPTYQLIKSWNCTPISIKSEGEEDNFKLLYISKVLESYDFECLKARCYSCQ
jgi:hypothetical protein